MFVLDEIPLRSQYFEFCFNLQFLYKNLLIFILLKFLYSENRKNPELILKINFTSCKPYKSTMILSWCLTWIIQMIQTCNNLILHQFTLKIIEIRRDKQKNIGFLWPKLRTQILTQFLSIFENKYSKIIKMTNPKVKIFHLSEDYIEMYQTIWKILSESKDFWNYRFLKETGNS